MADNMCGPSNAAKGLVTHADRDRSRHQDRLVGPQRGGNASFRTQPAPHAGADGAFEAFQRGAHGGPTPLVPSMAGLNIGDNHYMRPPIPPTLAGPAGFPVGHQGQSYAGPRVDQPALDAANYHEFLSTMGGRGHHSPGPHYQAASAATTQFPGAADPSMANTYHNQRVANETALIPQQSEYSFNGSAIGHGMMPSFYPRLGHGIGQVHPHASNVGPVGAHPDVSNVGPVPWASQDDKEASDSAFNAAFGAYDEEDFDREINTWISEHGQQHENDIKEPTSEEMAVIDANLENMAEELEARRAAGDPAVLPQRGPEAEARRTRQEQEDLVRAATGILGSVSDNQSDKFRNSSFLDLMRRIQRMEVVVSGTNLVDADTGETVMSQAQVDGEGSQGANGKGDGVSDALPAT